MDGQKSNGKVDGLKEEAFRLCQEYLGEQWSTASMEDFVLTVVRGGFSNQLYLCRLSEKAASKNRRAPNEVLFRIYGLLQEDENNSAAEASTFMLLSERNLGPKLYGVFAKGRLEEYIPSRIMNSDDIRRYSSSIAKEMAKIHSLDVPIKKVPDLIPYYTLKWLDKIAKTTSKDPSHAISFTKNYPAELEWLSSQIEKMKSPVVYCHNDLQGGNILLREDTGKNKTPSLMLIDFEFGTYNYRGFDIANQFCEWCFDYNTKDYPYFKVDFERYPTREEQVDYIEAYLNQLKEMDCLDEQMSIPEETENILKEVMVLRLASHLLWSTWSCYTSLTSSKGFAYWEYTKVRFQGYQMHKKELLNTPFFKDMNPNENGCDECE